MFVFRFTLRFAGVDGTTVETIFRFRFKVRFLFTVKVEVKVHVQVQV
jgi:hypothetical protein